MRIYGLTLKALLAAFVVLLLTDLLPDAEAAPARKGKESRRISTKPKGRPERRRTKGNGRSNGKGKKRASTIRLSFTDCPGNEGHKKGQNSNEPSAARAVKEQDVIQTLRSTVTQLERVNKSLTALMGAMTSNDTINFEYGMRELNPPDFIKLASDKEFKLLGQMTYLVNRIDVSLRYLKERHHTLVPSAIDPNTLKETSLGSAQEDVQKLLMYLRILRHQVNFPEKGKGKNALKCGTVRVKTFSDISKERSRAFVIIRDAQRAVDRMLQPLKDAKVVPKNSGFSINKEVMDQSVFYRCQVYACDLRGRCRMCL